MSDHNPTTCIRCHAAELIVAGLEILSPDDSTIECAVVLADDCGAVRLMVNSDDVGKYQVIIRAEIRP